MSEDKELQDCIDRIKKWKPVKLNVGFNWFVKDVIESDLQITVKIGISVELPNSSKVDSTRHFEEITESNLSVSVHSLRDKTQEQIVDSIVSSITKFVEYDISQLILRVR